MAKDQGQQRTGDDGGLRMEGSKCKAEVAKGGAQRVLPFSIFQPHSSFSPASLQLFILIHHHASPFHVILLPPLRVAGFGRSSALFRVRLRCSALVVGCSASVVGAPCASWVPRVGRGCSVSVVGAPWPAWVLRVRRRCRRFGGCAPRSSSGA